MSVIDDYLDTVPAPERKALERIRHIVHDTAPDTEEVISYGMPGFKYKGSYLAGFAPFKDHLSFFPTSTPIEILKTKLKHFTLSRGTVQFTLENPLPESLIKEMLLLRIQSIDKTK